MVVRTRALSVVGSSVAAALALTACGSTGTSSTGAAEGSYDVGLLAAEQGAFAFAGTSYVRGAELAVEQLNASGMLDEPLALKKEEGSEKPDQSINGYNRLKTDGALAVVCCISSSPAGALKPLAATAKTPLVVYGATLPGLQSPPNVYRPSLLPQTGIEQAATKIAKALGPKTAVHLAASDNDGLVSQEEAARTALSAAGVQDLGVVNTLVADTDFSGAVTQVLSKKPDMVTVYLLGEQAATVVKSLREQGYEGIILANNAVATKPNLKSFGATLAGTFYSVEYFPTSTLPAAQEFTKAYQDAHGEAPDTFASQGYVAMQYVAAGIDKAEAKGEVDAAAVGNALAEVGELDTVWGPLTFDGGQGEAEQFQVVQMDESGAPALWTPPAA